MEYQGKTMRQELKYAMNNLDFASLQSRLLPLLKGDEHVGMDGEYHVRSLYFDNYANDAYFDKETGEFQRGKYRIRIYNRSDSIIRLEFKEKFGQSTTKSSCMIDRQLYLAIIGRRLQYNDVKDNPFLRIFYIKVKCEQLEPKVIVDYIRKPYVCHAGNVRITFDRDLRVAVNSNDIFSSNLVMVPPGGYSSMILEVKYDDYLPLFVLKQLNLKSHQKLAISKYTICREMKNALNWKETLL